MRKYLLIFFWLITTTAGATHYYVKNGGSNAASGLDDANAWATIAYVNGRTFSPDDIISFKCGSTWNETVGLYPQSSGTSGHNIVFNSYGSGTAPTIAGTWMFSLLLSGKSYVTVDGIIFDGSNTTNGPAKITNWSYYITITNCVFKSGNTGWLCGLFITEGGHHYIGYNEFCYNGSGGHGHGIYNEIADCVFEHNNCHHNSGFGIHLFYNDGMGCDNNIVRYNYCHNNGAGLVVAKGNYNEVYYNIIVNNSGVGTGASGDGLVVGESTGNEIYNNTISGNGGYGLTLGSTTSYSFARNNIVYGDRIYDLGTGNTLSNNLTTDPSFINGGGSYLLETDFQIQSSSSAKDAGYTVGISPDYFGNKVPYNTITDIGAHEYTTVTDEGNPIPPANPVYVSSAIENASPSVIEMIYNMTLANIVPAASAFTVTVNSVARSINAVAVSGTKVLLTLASPVVYGNVVTVAYTRPETNPLQTAAGGQAATLSAQTVTNKVSAVVVNTPPVVVINSAPTSLSGFVGELDATGSYDLNHDNLSYTWVVPTNISVSSTNSSKIKFLSPIVDAPQTFEFKINISDGKTTQSKIVKVGIIPYKPELDVAEILSVEASSFKYPNYPQNILDGNIGTIWAASGNDQWLILELKESFNIQHVMLAFQQGQKRESYFDILGSEDKITWEPVLTKSASCGFSGDLQVFEFPPTKAEKEFKYVKLVGKSNAVDSWNYISEFKIFGYKHRNPSSYEEQPVKLYPNPASEFVNIRVDDMTMKPDFIRIINTSGKVVFQGKINLDTKDFQIPINLKQGLYIVQMGSGNLTLFTQKLVVNN